MPKAVALPPLHNPSFGMLRFMPRSAENPSYLGRGRIDRRRGVGRRGLEYRHQPGTLDIQEPHDYAPDVSLKERSACLAKATVQDGS
jgi:hypothetical protein